VGLRDLFKFYEELLFQEGENVFIFLDPPYLEPTKSRLYGKNGFLHTSFDHERFAENMKKCNHKRLITYDDNSEIREMFDFANIYEWELQYGMNNYKQEKANKGHELFISNYDLNLPKQESFDLIFRSESYEYKESHTTRGQNPVVQKAIVIQDMLAQKDTAVDWDSTAEIRKLRERNRF
jgi:hypothetical protein